MRQSAAAKIANVWTGSAGSLSARAGVFTQNFRHCFGSREVNEYSPAPVSKRARAISKGTYHAAFPYVVAVWQVDSEGGAKDQVTVPSHQLELNLRMTLNLTPIFLSELLLERSQHSPGHGHQM
ncbi:MAG: hypothetical protein JO232_02015 [Verrucomicrobia bacterium]|nr:hypothetical protein [Verrucomicrobiota bacterium]